MLIMIITTIVIAYICYDNIRYILMYYTAAVFEVTLLFLSCHVYKISR